MEGYYWRFADPASGRAIDRAVRRLPRARTGRGRLVALAAHPGGFVRWRDAPRRVGRPATRSASPPRRRGGRAARVASGALRLDLGADARLEAALEGRVGWPRRALGGARRRPRRARAAAVLASRTCSAARVRGEALLGGEPRRLDGAEAYAEKNWGARVPRALVVGPGRRFGDGGDGRVRRRPAAAGRWPPRALVVRAGGEVAAPARRRRASHARWPRRRRAGGAGRGRRAARSSSRARPPRAAPHVLPVPVPAERRAVELRSEHHLAGGCAPCVRRGRRVVLREESALAGPGARLLRRLAASAERLGAHQPLEAADHRPQRAQAHRGAAVHGLHARLGDELGAAVAGVARPSARTARARCPARTSRGSPRAPSRRG